MSETCAAASLDPHLGKPPGSRCREWDGQQPGWAYDGPLCETEVRAAERDAGMLLWDVLDLEQMLPKPYGQALDSQPAGKPGPPIPLAAAVEALQAEIVHVTTTWEEIVRDHAGLSQVPPRGPNAPWHTTVSRRPPPARVRAGAAVQRALSILSPRLPLLARLQAVAVQPAGVEDVWTEVAGWEAVLTLSGLHSRARSMLGRTRRTRLLPGDCSGCGAADLRQDEPRDEGDDPPVYCGQCVRAWTLPEYERYVMLQVYPGMVAA